MSFDVAADAYDRFMGRYSGPLATQFADFAGVRPGQRVLDVGCGPGALTAELVRRVGPDAVAAVDPSEPFVLAARARYPGVDVRRSGAERLPYSDDAFDATLAQLVVHFMTDPVAGIKEMARVTRPKGIVAACVWDHAGDRSPISIFWQAARDLDPGVIDQSGLAGAQAGALTTLFEASGLRQIDGDVVYTSVDHASFDEWWAPFTFGVGPAGAYVRGLSDARRSALRERCRTLLPEGPFAMTGAAWAARGVA